MTEKWKDFWSITGVAFLALPGEAMWTVLLAKITSKIPYIGIPLAATIGAIGAFGAIWVGRTCSLAYEDWYNEYCVKNEEG